MNSEKVKTLLEFPWSGENYSQKIWGCDDRFVKMLNKNLSLGLVTGQTYSEIIKSIKKECDAQKYQIERLVRTEGTFIANQGSLDNNCKFDNKTKKWYNIILKTFCKEYTMKFNFNSFQLKFIKDLTNIDANGEINENQEKKIRHKKSSKSKTYPKQSATGLFNIICSMYYTTKRYHYSNKGVSK